MMAIFGGGGGNSYEPDENLGSKSNFFPIGRKSSPAGRKLSPAGRKSSPDDRKSSPVGRKSSPVDGKTSPTAEFENVSKKEKPKKKKKLSGSKGIMSADVTSRKVDTLSVVTRPSEARRHSVSVVVTAPPVQPPDSANDELPSSAVHSSHSSHASHARRRRRSHCVPMSYDYNVAMLNALKYRNHLNVDDDDDDDCDGGESSGPLIRPPIVVLTSQHRKHSLQTEYDVGPASFILSLWLISIPGKRG